MYEGNEEQWQIWVSEDSLVVLMNVVRWFVRRTHRDMRRMACAVKERAEVHALLTCVRFTHRQSPSNSRPPGPIRTGCKTTT